MRYSLLFVLLLPAVIKGQIVIEGTVTDAADNSPLPYVNIYVKNTAQGTYTDVKGNFRMEIYASEATVVFSYLGYEKKEVLVNTDAKLYIKLNELTLGLEEVIVLPGENPADVIMRQVVENRDKHDPENLNTFQYTSYNKFVVNIDRQGDTLPPAPPPTFKSAEDSAEYYEELGIEDTLVNKMNLFLMESVTEKKYRKPGKYTELVAASRVSGLENGQFVLRATEMQSFSFYKNYIKILGREYLSPIARGNTKKYLFILQDTVEPNGEQLYVIYYQPRKGKNFSGLTGLLYINSVNYAVLKATAKVVDKSGTESQVVQEYSKFDSVYFPTVFTSDIILGGADFVIVDTTQKKTFTLVGKSRTTLSDIKLNEFIPRKEFDNIELDYAPDATKKDDSYWEKHRAEELNSKDSLTYTLVDSIGKKLNFDRKLEIYRILVSGEVPVGPVSLRLNDIARYNNFEGFRLGVGVYTNNRLSRRVKLGGYYGYGFKDVHSKYGGSFTLFLNKGQTSNFTALYNNDVQETGMQTFELFKPEREEKIRDYYVSVMDRVERSKASLTFMMLRYVTANVSFERVNKQVTTSYRFGDGLDNYFRFSNANLTLRWAPGEKLVRSFDRLVAHPSRGLEVLASITQSFKGVIDGEFDFTKLDLMINYKFRLRNAGHTHIRLMGGMVQGNVPYTDLYFARSGKPKRYRLVIPYSFETMTFNEFFNDSYQALFIRHNFGSLLYKGEKFRPLVSVITNIMFGQLSNPEIHKFYNLKPTDKGYYESGLQVDNLYSSNGYFSWGIGLFYRYGAYTLPKTSDNFTWKLSSTFNF